MKVAGWALALSVFTACGSNAVPDVDDAGQGERNANVDAPRRPAFCSRDAADAVHDLFCAESPPAIRSLDDLQVELALKPDVDFGAMPADEADHELLASVAVLGHSTALAGRFVSPINPRVIVMGVSTFLAFVRGTQRVELMSQDRDTGLFAFYLVDFEQDCNRTRDGCSPGDLYTPRVESDWKKLAIRDGVELENTPLDCRACHQRATDMPTLLMRELDIPWTHFFYPSGDARTARSGVDLMSDYVEAKGDELYAGYPLDRISDTTPFLLESRAGPSQPLLFDALTIESELYAHVSDEDDSEPQASQTWERAYAAFKRGEQLALPYLEPRATDPDKQAALTEAYRSYREGEIDADELPDLGDIFPDDGLERARRGLQTEPDATPEQTLIEGCASCHNDQLDQTVSRARFNVRVSSLDRAELDRAIDRLKRPTTSAGAMPPADARQLDPAARDRLIEYLRGDPSSLDPDGVLRHAARLGMIGGSGRSRSIGIFL
jgi:cytochrome c553